MKTVIITLALAGLASTASLDAQILGSRLPTPTTNRGTSVDGSWRVVGRDGNGNTIYERRTTDRNGNIVIQRARRDGNGNLSIISTRTVRNTDDRNRRNCDYNRTTNSIGDIIFGRANDVNCDDVGNREDGGWYQVGRGRDNNSIYERRTRRNGNLVIQRARRNSNGTMTIISTRYANDNDRQWRKDQKKRDKEWRKEEKRQDKESRKSQRGDDDRDGDHHDGNYRNGNYENGNYENDNQGYRGDDNSYRSNKAVARGNGRGKDNGKGKHKGKG